jgi:hypothetical protein
MPRAPTIAAAATVRGSAPSGRTIRFTSARAVSMRRWRKAGGERRGTRVGSAKERAQVRSTWSATKLIVFSTLSASSTGMVGFIEAT